MAVYRNFKPLRIYRKVNLFFGVQPKGDVMLGIRLVLSGDDAVKRAIILDLVYISFGALKYKKLPDEK